MNMAMNTAMNTAMNMASSHGTRALVSGHTTDWVSRLTWRL
jgi:hypothetical protein